MGRIWSGRRLDASKFKVEKFKVQSSLLAVRLDTPRFEGKTIDWSQYCEFSLSPRIACLVILWTLNFEL
ncbi:MAG: hypothetical protein DMG06_22055 [Acidobacteria bacterium]|nr:MAG: hypothetical protein DMG06_22055 [Acidobacteriota bacterium]